MIAWSLEMKRVEIMPELSGEEELGWLSINENAGLKRIALLFFEDAPCA